MPKYTNTTVPPKGNAPEPIHNYFERQLPSDIFTEWKYNAVIDNIIVLMQQLPPFYISGIEIEVDVVDENQNICMYTYNNGLVSCKGLVYVFGGVFTTPYSGTYVVRVSGSTGMLLAVPIESYNYEYDIENGFCKIAYVCKGNVQYAHQELYSFLKDLPVSEARYNALCYYGGHGRYQ